MTTESDTILRRFLLALCVYREASGEPQEGRIYVAQVIRNRVEDKRWPDTYEGVITQPWQFSSFNQNDPNNCRWPKTGDEIWRQCLAAADAVLNSTISMTTANHYHTVDPPNSTMAWPPKWAVGKPSLATVGHHVFYCL